MKKIIIYLFFSLSATLYAQDQLFKKDNSKIEVKILEINPTEIKYKLFTYQDGPTIIVSKKDVALIIYQNGVHEVITVPAETPTEVPYVVYNRYPTPVKINHDSIEKVKMDQLLSTKNLVSFNMLEPINGSFGASYLREFASNYFNVYVPVSIGFAAPYFTQSVNTLFNGNSYYYYNGGTNANGEFHITNYTYTNKTYEIGLGIHFQTSGRRAVTHFVGPYIGTSQFTGTYTKTEYYYDSNGYYNYSVDNKTFTMNRLYVMLNNGLLFRVTKNFNIILLAGLGYHIDTYKTADDLTKAYNYNRNGLPLNAFKGGISFGYRF